jgi:putative glutamine amidotransferase
MLTTKNKTARALVWLPADHRFLGNEGERMPYLVLGDKYARAIKTASAAQPVLFPLADASQIPSLLEWVDGVMLTGSASNVHPAHFGQAVEDPSLPLDPERDAITLALVKACVAAAVPLLGVCRGFQEINVALGGSLEQTVQARAGYLDHRAPDGVTMDEAYGPAHEVEFAADCAFALWAGGTKQKVNSLHGQGIARLAKGLRAVGHAPDGLVEAVEIENAQTFAYAVQWHPEYRVGENPFYRAIFAAFGEACHRRHASRL